MFFNWFNDYLSKTAGFKETEKIAIEKEKLLEVNKMLATRMNEYREKLLFQGREEGREQGIEEGIEKGREEGREEEIEKSKIENAKKMFQKGYPIQDIIDIFDISQNELKKIIEA